MCSSEQGAELERIHSVGLVNSKTPSQISSFQGQQVTVTLSLYAEGVNVRERQLPRPKDQCQLTFQGVWAQGSAPHPVHSLYSLTPLDSISSHEEAHLLSYSHRSKEKANETPWTKQSFQSSIHCSGESPKWPMRALGAVWLRQKIVKAQLP